MTLERIGKSPLLGQSHSVPTLLGLGVSPSKKDPMRHARPMTLGYRLEAPIDSYKYHLHASPEAKRAAEHIRGQGPSWRLSGNLNQSMSITEAEELPKDNTRWPRIAPAWLKHQCHVLRFYGYFQEHVVEKPDENCRYRQIVIQYFMEDGTLMITEPKVENSGIKGGVFLKRHQVPRASDPSTLMGPDDIRIGEDILIYGHKYHVTGCDRFTRWFYEENGVDIGQDEGVPQTAWEKSYVRRKAAEEGKLPPTRNAVEAKQFALYQLGTPPNDGKLVQFLNNDRKVLRFKGYWDDPTPYGNRIYFTIHYYLADNTCEVNEAHCRNSGRDNYPVFYKRNPLFKENSISAYPGMLEPDKELYTPKDLLVGQSIYLYGREIVIYDCDDFTRNFYHHFMGVDQKESQISVKEAPITHLKLLPPPHCGLGTEEDSLMNCNAIQPKPAKQDLARLMQLSGEVLRFQAKLANGESEDDNRRFVLGFFPADDQVAAWEEVVRNSGHMAGRFCEKSKMTNPDTGEYYKLEEFAVGKRITIRSAPFHIIRADERALQFLERMPRSFPFADPRACAHHIASCPQLVQHPEMQAAAGIHPDRVKELAESAGLHDLIDHELITLLRVPGFSIPGADGQPLLAGSQVLAAAGIATGDEATKSPGGGVRARISPSA